MSLKEHLDFLSHEIAFWALGIDDPKYPIGQLGSLSENLSYQLRSLAIITLLIEGDTNLFYHNLIRSGLVREAFLKRCQTEKYKDYYCAISRSGAFFDTVAAGDFDLAKRIAKLSPDGWISDGEYEDDYCFAKFFQLIIRPNTSQETLNTLLEKFETSLEGDISSNIELCQAFMDSDQSKKQILESSS